jgi:hypothetical protein
VPCCRDCDEFKQLFAITHHYYSLILVAKRGNSWPFAPRCIRGLGDRVVDCIWQMSAKTGKVEMYTKHSLHLVCRTVSPNHSRLRWKDERSEDQWIGDKIDINLSG